MYAVTHGGRLSSSHRQFAAGVLARCREVCFVKEQVVPLSMQHQAPAVPATVASFFDGVARLIFEGYERRRIESGIPDVHVTLILADEFAREVNRWLPAGERYDPARAGGGESVAKTISRTADHAESVIVFDATLWHTDIGVDANALRASLIAHELAHPLLNRARWASGALHGLSPQPTVVEVLRDAAHGLADEYRATVISEFAIGALGTVTVEGETRPLRSWWSRGPGYVERFAAIVAQAEPAWSDIVRATAAGQNSPQQAWMMLAGAVNGALRALMDAQAFADAAEAGEDILDDARVADLPATRRFLADAVSPFIEAVREAWPLAPLIEIKAAEEEIADVGIRMLEMILERIGIRTTSAADGSVQIIIEPGL
jgi:hypothetical protein